MVPEQNYKKFITELVRRHMVVIGPNIALETANLINGLEVDQTGAVTAIQGSPNLILQDLSNNYQKLSPQITLLTLHLLFEQYKDIKAEYNQPLPRVRLICALNEEVQ